MATVNLGELLDLLEICRNPYLPEGNRGFVHRATGKTVCVGVEELSAVAEEYSLEDFPEWQQSELHIAKEIDDNWCYYIEFKPLENWESYAIIESFCEQVEPASDREHLLDRIRGRGAFSRFHNDVRRLGIEHEWYAWRDKRHKEYVKDWCISHGLDYHDSVKEGPKIEAFELEDF